jgi:hypothetical protein
VVVICELPYPFGAENDQFSIRLRAIADAVAGAAAATGAKTVHRIVGHMHAHEVAVRLASGHQSMGPCSSGVFLLN